MFETKKTVLEMMGKLDKDGTVPGELLLELREKMVSVLGEGATPEELDLMRKKFDEKFVPMKGKPIAHLSADSAHSLLKHIEGELECLPQAIEGIARFIDVQSEGLSGRRVYELGGLGRTLVLCQAMITLVREGLEVLMKSPKFPGNEPKQEQKTETATTEKEGTP